MKLNKEHQKKHDEYRKELNKKVETLKTLLDSGDIMYIDLSTIVDEINMLKNLITTNQIYNDIEYNSHTGFDEDTEEGQ